MYQQSKHNIFSKIKDSNEYYLVNILSGNADILEPDEALKFKENRIDNSYNFV